MAYNKQAAFACDRLLFANLFFQQDWLTAILFPMHKSFFTLVKLRSNKIYSYCSFAVIQVQQLHVSLSDLP